MNLGRMAMPMGNGGSWRNVYGRNSSAMDGTDDYGARYGILTSTGYRWGSDQFAQAHAGVRATSLFNPTISNTQAATNQAAFGTTQGFIGLRSVGIQSVGKGGVRKTTMQIANEILKQVDPNETVKSVEDAQIFVYDPMSYLNQTLSNWVANGVINPDQVKDVQENILGILKARASGMSVSDLARNLGNYDAKNKTVRQAARSALRQAGIANTQMQGDKNLESEQRQATIQRLDGFERGLFESTRGLEKFHEKLNAVTDRLGPINDLRGAWKGLGEHGWLGRAAAAASMPGVASGVLNSIPGGGLVSSLMGLGGSAETRMSVTAGGSSSLHIAGGVGAGGNKSGGAGGSARGGASSGGKSSTSNGRLSWPCKGPITAKWGQAGSSWSSGYHTGLDIGVGNGTPIKAAAGGKVITAGYHSAYGNQIVIDHGNGIQTQYAHNSRLRVGVGDEVRQGEVISYSGETGNTSGPHLHFEVRINGKSVDPLKYLNGAPLAVSAGSSSKSKDGRHSDTSSGSGESYSGGGPSVSGTSELEILQAAFGASSAGSGTSVGASDLPGAKSGGGSKGRANYAGISGGGSSSANQRLGRQMAARMGWTGRQWQDLLALWNKESGWNHTADNPTSSAYGIPQALIAMHKMPQGYVDKTSGSGAGTQGFGGDPKAQIAWGLNYIKNRYGNPSAAWAFHKRNNWYEQGAWEVKQDEDARVHKGEMVVPKPMADTIRATLLQQAGIRGGQGGQGLKIEFGPNSINVTVGAGATAAQGREVGKAIVSAIADDKRIQALQNG